MWRSLEIKTHKLNRHYENDHFFVLSKGSNAGKPLDGPCPNCFVIITHSNEEKEKLYWLCKGLWQSNRFHQFLIGSVIPFVRIGEFKDELEEAFRKAENRPDEFNRTVNTLKKLDAFQDKLMKQLKLVRQLKAGLMDNFLKETDRTVATSLKKKGKYIR